MVNSQKFVKNMIKFHVICKSKKGVQSSFEMLEKDYQTLWLKLDSLDLTIVKIEKITT